jgi:DtxR family transcriptional regulator, Mn-dependent transcriptional regulator
VNESALTSSLENYLEAIYVLEENKKVARVKDIADYIGVQMPSVTGAIKNLKTRGLIHYEKNSYISLTEQGKIIARQVHRKHSVLQCFLENILLIPEDRASAAACEMEHALDPDTAERLCNSIKYFTSELLEHNKISRREWENILTGKRTPCTICHTWPEL